MWYSYLLAFLGFLLVYCFVEMPLVALPTCGCWCHKCPYQRGKAILLGKFDSVRTIIPAGSAAAQENTISNLLHTVFLVCVKCKLTLVFAVLAFFLLLNLCVFVNNV